MLVQSSRANGRQKQIKKETESDQMRALTWDPLGDEDHLKYEAFQMSYPRISVNGFKLLPGILTISWA